MIYKDIVEAIKNKNLNELESHNLAVITYYRFLKENEYFKNRYKLLRLTMETKTGKLNIKIKSINFDTNIKVRNIDFISNDKYGDYEYLNNESDEEMLLFWKEKIEKSNKIEDIISLFENDENLEKLYKYQYYLNNEDNSFYSEEYDDDLLWNIHDFELNENINTVKELSYDYLRILNNKGVSFKNIEQKEHKIENNNYFKYLKVQNNNKNDFFNYNFFQIKKIMTLLRIDEFLKVKNEKDYIIKYKKISDDLIKIINNKYFNDNDNKINFIKYEKESNNKIQSVILDKTIDQKINNGMIFDINQEMKKAKYMNYDNIITKDTEDSYLLTLNNNLENLIIGKLMFNNNYLSIKYFSSVDNNVENIKEISKKIIEEMNNRNIKIINLDILSPNAIKKDVDVFLNLYNELDKNENILVINEYEHKDIKRENNRKYELVQKIKSEMDLLKVYELYNLNKDELNNKIKTLNKIKKEVMNEIKEDMEKLSDSSYLLAEKKIIKKIKTKIINIEKNRFKNWIKNESKN